MNKRKSNLNNVTNQIKIRTIIVICAFIFICFGAVAYNMFNIQIINYDEYKAKATSIQLRDTEISAKRGTIYDANMKVLAQSATVWTIFVSPAESKSEQHEQVASVLSEILEVDKETILTKLQKTSSYYEVIKYKVDKPIADEVRQICKELNLQGVNLVEDYKRYYPYGSFAATILGFCGTDNQGLAGLEAYYDTELTGTKGRVISAKNGWGLDMGNEYEVINPAQDGYNLVTTIDETIQHYLEKRLSYAAQEHNVSERAVGIVMNVKTGAILAMATKPDFDPNDPFTIQDEALAAVISEIQDDAQRKEALNEARQAQWRNKAVADLYEPGSVFKIVTAASALDSGTSTLNSSFNCSGSVKVGVHTMKCAQVQGHGHQSFSQALINSCNPAFIAIGQSMGSNLFYDYFYSFGLAEKTGIDLPGEAQSIYYGADMGTVSLSSAAFGQSNKISPIQMITAVATAVNGGNLVTPHVVSKIIDSDGNLIEDKTPPIKRQVISQETSEAVNAILKQNVDPGGHGGNAYVIGYRVGGKSGTSQKLDTAIEDDYIASFVGVAPMDDPEIAVLILLDTPNSYSYFGGALAGPIVGALMGEILPYLGIEAVYSESELSQANVYVPDISGLSITDASVKLQRSSLTVKVIGSGDTVVSQFPVSGIGVSKGSVVIAYTENSTQTMVTVPDLVGKTKTAAQSALNSVSLNVKAVGAASNNNVTVLSQSINPGEKVPMGTVITVTYADTTLVD